MWRIAAFAEELQRLVKASPKHENVATDWFELKKDSVTLAYAEDIWRLLTLHVFPDLKASLLAKIAAPMVIALLRSWLEC